MNAHNGITSENNSMSIIVMLTVHQMTVKYPVKCTLLINIIPPYLIFILLTTSYHITRSTYIIVVYHMVLLRSIKDKLYYYFFLYMNESVHTICYTYTQGETRSTDISIKIEVNERIN